MASYIPLLFLWGLLGPESLGSALQWVFPRTWAPGRGVGDILGWSSSRGELESPCDSLPWMGTGGVPLNLMSQAQAGRVGLFGASLQALWCCLSPAADGVTAAPAQP